MKRIFLIVFIAALAFLQACKDDDATCTEEVTAETLATVDQTRLTADIQAIEEYLTVNSITGAQYAPSELNGVRYVIKELGTGAKLQCLENIVTVKTTGWLLKSGNEFQPTAEFSFRLNQLILGWQLALPLIPAGSKVTLYIPSGYGYGVAGTSNGKVPSNANLIFDIELIAVN